MIETTVKCDHYGCYQGKTSPDEAKELGWYQIEGAEMDGAFFIAIKPFGAASNALPENIKHSCSTHMDDIVQELASEWGNGKVKAAQEKTN